MAVLAVGQHDPCEEGAERSGEAHQAHQHRDGDDDGKRGGGEHLAQSRPRYESHERRHDKSARTDDAPDSAERDQGALPPRKVLKQ